MFGWLPIVGPVIDGVVSIFSKQKDTQLEMKKIDGEVYVKASEIQAQTLRDFKDQIDVRLMRDIVCFPVCTWTALIVWDKIWTNRNEDLVWNVAPIGEATGIAWLPYAVMVFLLGNIALNKWKR